MNTVRFAREICGVRSSAITPEAMAEAKRSLVNWVGVAVGASRHPMVDMVLEVCGGWGGGPQATVIGRGTKTDEHTAALVNGISSHIFDYDDTLLDTILHPSAPVLPALLAYAEREGAGGKKVLEAFVVGVEAEQRVAQVVCPSHYARGWHVTGSVGAFGAAAGVGWLMGLNERQMANALGIAATQPVGLREMFGTHTKAFHPGKAAANGLLSARLAARGFTSSARALEAPRGFAHVTSEDPRLEGLTDGWGQRWQILDNSYKPFPCGVVIHPVIDSMARLHAGGVRAGDVERIEIGVHRLVLELTGKKEPRDGLEARFSVYHCAAAGLIDGWVGLPQLTDSRVASPDVLALRGRVVARVDADLAEDQARVKAILRSGKAEEVFVEHCLGSRENPMTNEQLERKFLEVTADVLDGRRGRALLAALWDFDRAPDVGAVLGLTAAGRSAGRG